MLQRALNDLGIDDDAMEQLGIRLIRLGMPFPLDAEELVAMTGDLEQVLVVEDKVPFLEGHLKQALYRSADAPVVVGRHGEDGRPLLSARGTLSAEEGSRGPWSGASVPTGCRSRPRAVWPTWRRSPLPGSHCQRRLPVPPSSVPAARTAPPLVPTTAPWWGSGSAVTP